MKSTVSRLSFGRILRSLAVLAVMIVMCPAPSEAKRTGPPEVKPVEAEGVRYVVPQDNGRKAVVRAVDAASGKLLWEAVLFEVKVDPALEEDVQWVFVQSLKLEKTALRAVDERGRVWLLDLKTRKVKEAAK